MYETQLISPHGEAYSMQYYEIGAFAEKVCNQYIAKKNKAIN